MSQAFQNPRPDSKTDNSRRPELQPVVDLCSADMARVDDRIREALASDVVLINQIAHYIVSSGGKRLRPMLLVLSAHACGYTGSQHINLAAIIEFIHTATLLHDDVVDESETRRGQQTAHAVWGNAASVLVGDFLYSRSFQMMIESRSMRVMEILADTTNTIAEGEVQQLLNMGDPETDEARYLQVIENKTAKLFEAACRLGAVIADQPAATEEALARFGNRLGCAFQIADDVMDYTGDRANMGKNIGDDLAEGKPTLPLIHARARSAQREREIIDHSIQNGSVDNLDAILRIIRATGANASALSRARELADAALAAISDLPASKWLDGLRTLCEYSHQRDH